MKFAILADIHSNLEALNAVLEAAGKVDIYIIAGDIVGYGPDPNACIQRVKKLDPIIVAGNHDKAVSDDISIDQFTDEIRKSLDWTKKELTASNMSYLKGLETYKKVDGIEIVHGSLRDPLHEYITDFNSGAATMELMKSKHLFVGHLHIPIAIGIDKNGKYIGWQLDDGDTVSLEDHEKVIINPGAVGQPRDMDKRASFGIYDGEKNTFELKKVDYDIAKVQAKIRKTVIPDFFAERLAHGR